MTPAYFRHAAKRWFRRFWTLSWRRLDAQRPAAPAFVDPLPPAERVRVLEELAELCRLHCGDEAVREVEALLERKRAALPRRMEQLELWEGAA